MTDTSQNSKTIKNIMKLLDKVFWELHPLLTREWYALNLTMAQFKLITLLFQRGQCRMGEIADELGLNLATATGVVERMVLRGFVVREKSTEDRRIVFCRLSKKGENLMDSYRELYRERMGGFLKLLDARQLQLVKEVVEVFIEGNGKLLDKLVAAQGKGKAADNNSNY